MLDAGFNDAGSKPFESIKKPLKTKLTSSRVDSTSDGGPRFTDRLCKLGIAVLSLAMAPSF
jgi:hypothetical protein